MIGHFIYDIYKYIVNDHIYTFKKLDRNLEEMKMAHVGLLHIESTISEVEGKYVSLRVCQTS